MLADQQRPAGSMTAELMDFPLLRHRDRALVSYAHILVVQRRAVGNRRT
jgi:hypothetical protein